MHLLYITRYVTFSYAFRADVGAIFTYVATVYDYYWSQVIFVKSESSAFYQHVWTNVYS